MWLFGPWKKLVAKSVKVGDITHDSEDVSVGIIECEKCPLVTYHLNYLSRRPYRNITIHTENKSIILDLVNSKMSINEKDEMVNLARNETYRLMHMSILSEHTADVCSINEGVQVMRLIDAIERSSASDVWIKNA